MMLANVWLDGGHINIYSKTYLTKLPELKRVEVIAVMAELLGNMIVTLWRFLRFIEEVSKENPHYFRKVWLTYVR